MNKGKVLNLLLSIIVILIVVIFSAMYYLVYDHKAEISVYNEIRDTSNIQSSEGV